MSPIFYTHMRSQDAELVGDARCTGRPRISTVRPGMTQSTHNLDTPELLALLRDASLKPESIADEIDCAGAQRCTAEEVARARELLARLAADEAAQAAGIAPQGAVAPEQVARDIAARPDPPACPV